MGNQQSVTKAVGKAKSKKETELVSKDAYIDPQWITNEILFLNLTKVTVQNAELVYVPKVLFEAKTITQLNLSNNQLRSISGIGALNGITSLDLSNNEIDYLPDDFPFLWELKTLDLSGNRLSERGVSPVLFQLSALESLKLHKNSISSIQRDPAGFFLIKLLTLTLHDNPWDTTRLSPLADLSSSSTSNDARVAIGKVFLLDPPTLPQQEEVTSASDLSTAISPRRKKSLPLNVDVQKAPANDVAPSSLVASTLLLEDPVQIKSPLTPLGKITSPLQGLFMRTRSKTGTSPATASSLEPEKPKVDLAVVERTNEKPLATAHRVGGPRGRKPPSKDFLKKESDSDTSSLPVTSVKPLSTSSSLAQAQSAQASRQASRSQKDSVASMSVVSSSDVPVTNLDEIADQGTTTSTGPLSRTSSAFAGRPSHTATNASNVAGNRFNRNNGSSTLLASTPENKVSDSTTAEQPKKTPFVLAQSAALDRSSSLVEKLKNQTAQRLEAEDSPGEETAPAVKKGPPVGGVNVFNGAAPSPRPSGDTKPKVEDTSEPPILSRSKPVLKSTAPSVMGQHSVNPKPSTLSNPNLVEEPIAENTENVGSIRKPKVWQQQQGPRIDLNEMVSKMKVSGGENASREELLKDIAVSKSFTSDMSLNETPEKKFGSVSGTTGKKIAQMFASQDSLGSGLKGETPEQPPIPIPMPKPKLGGSATLAKNEDVVEAPKLEKRPSANVISSVPPVPVPTAIPAPVPILPKPKIGSTILSVQEPQGSSSDTAAPTTGVRAFKVKDMATAPSKSTITSASAEQLTEEKRIPIPVPKPTSNDVPIAAPVLPKKPVVPVADSTVSPVPAPILPKKPNPLQYEPSSVDNSSSTPTPVQSNSSSFPQKPPRPTGSKPSSVPDPSIYSSPASVPVTIPSRPGLQSTTQVSAPSSLDSAGPKSAATISNTDVTPTTSGVLPPRPALRSTGINLTSSQEESQSSSNALPARPPRPAYTATPSSVTTTVAEPRDTSITTTESSPGSSSLPPRPFVKPKPPVSTS